MIHIVTGPPCAGKSTYVREHAKDGDLRVDYDIIAQALGSTTSHAAKGLVKQAAFSAREGAIKEALNNTEAESWIIHTTPTEEHMKMYEAAGADIIELDPGYDVCMERAKQDGRPQQTINGIEKYYSEEKGNKMERKYKTFNLKADGDAGTISGYFSTYDRIPDSYGDVVAPGAFTDTIKAREETGHPFPLCWDHDLNQIIGKVDSIEDTEKGPLMTASFFDTPLAQEKREIVKSGVVYQFSFAYSILDQETVELEDGTKANELRKLDLYEISIVPIPANQNAVMTDVKANETATLKVEGAPEPDAEEVKAALVKAGRRNRKSDEDILMQIRDLVDQLLGNEVEDTDEPEEGEDEPEANANAEEPTVSNPAKARLLEYINNLK